MELDLQVIRQQVVHATKALLEQANLKAGDIFVLGCSSSEICGGHIGKASSEEAGQVVIDAILPVLRERGIFLAVQGCEHINRSLVVEREAAERYDLEIVTVKPALHAGGACAVAAYDRAEDPVMVEHITAKAGMDIGDTFIGQHIKHVQIPVRLDIDQIGAAHATFVRSRQDVISCICRTGSRLGRALFPAGQAFQKMGRKSIFYIDADQCPLEGNGCLFRSDFSPAAVGLFCGMDLS